MAIAVLTWLIAIPLLGFCTGLRSMTPIAVLCWFAWLGHLPVQGTWAFWTAHPVSVAVFTTLAAAELIGDKLPKTPPRTRAFPLIVRLFFGGFVGVIVATALSGSTLEGGFLATLAALLGAFGGLHLRHHAGTRWGWPDWRFALLEDAFALVASVLALSIITG